MTTTFPLEQFQLLRTPFYYYDTQVLRATLQTICEEKEALGNCEVHYAIKANANPKLLPIISSYGLGADCVSGGEIEAALNAGFPANKIVFAGVGKADWEICLGLDKGIFCFNVESVPELEVINELAGTMGKVANVAFRINPDVEAHTHAHITTGLAENKFGISMADMEAVIARASDLENVRFVGLHFHIGSQILDLEDDFLPLCERINALQDQLEQRRIVVENINVGGGLGVDYEQPESHLVPEFKRYMHLVASHLKLRSGQTLHFEPGRSVVAQCGALISRVLYVKQGTDKQFAILDAGMTELIRPALYQAHHKIENLTSKGDLEKYDVVGPICESSDVFDKGVCLPKVSRGDLIAIRSAGAYGESMASGYNCRALPEGYILEELI